MEDEKVVREFLMLQLSKWGYKVTEAEDGVQAILKLGKDNFDLIISDIMMPDKDGWELIKEVRLPPKTKNTPIIVLTTNDKDSDMFKGYELGANYYIPKPFTKAQLLHGIKLVFEENSNSIGQIDLSQRFAPILLSLF